MANRLDSSSHFLPLQDLPEFESSTSVLDAYKELATRKRGAFIYNADDSQYFVRADQLAADLFQGAAASAGADETRRRSELSLEQALEQFRTQSLLIEIPRAVMVTDDAAPLQLRGDMVFPVVTETGDPLGWFLNHETVLDPATERVFFLCENGHKNPDPDHGVCYSCPGRIVGGGSK